MDGNLVMGTIAGILTTTSFVPQVRRVWKNRPKPATDVSLGMFCLMCLGVLLWLIYGFTIHSWPLIIFNGITLLLAAAVLTYKLHYG